MPYFFHVPTLLEYQELGISTPPIGQFDEAPSDDWVEYIEPEYNPMYQNVIFNGPEYYVQYKPIEEIRKILHDKLKHKYFEVLNGGFKLPNGTLLGSDEEDRAIINAMETKLSIDNEITTINYKTKSGWITLRREDALLVYGAMLQHIAACDSRLNQLADFINTTNNPEILIADFETQLVEGWPTYDVQ